MKKGFTLIELLVVITIIGILAVGGIQIYSEQIKKARDSTNIKNLKILDGGIMQYIFDNGKTIDIIGVDNIEKFMHFESSLETYIPNIETVRHSQHGKSLDNCNYTTAEITGQSIKFCSFRYRAQNGTDKYKIYGRLESESNTCLNDCLTDKDGGSFRYDLELGIEPKLRDLIGGPLDSTQIILINLNGD